MSRVIRGTTPAGDEPATSPDAAPRVVPSDVYDARGEAARLLTDARAQAETIVREAHDAASRIRATARAEGHAAGHAEVAALLHDAQAARDGLLASAEQDVARLALVAAERIVGAALAAEPERIGAIVEDVLTRARRATTVLVRAAPADVPAIERLREHLRERAGLRGPLAVRADETIARGGCVVETNLGQLDARVEVQIAALARALGIPE